MVPRTTRRAGRSAPITPQWCRDRQGGRWALRNDVAELLALISPRGPDGGDLDWSRVEEGVGLRLPSDYKKFMDLCGPGLFCDITIAAPDPCDDVDLSQLLARKHEEARNSRRTPELTPFYPERLGLVSWGESSDGWTFGWGRCGDDPDQWGVVVVKPFPRLGTSVYFPDLSFSSFLVKYCGYRGMADPILGRDPWRGEISLAPHIHKSLPQ
jgi:hypothetical protein